MATIYEKVGENIRRLRKKADMRQEQLAVKSKLDLTTINEIESGFRNPSLKTLYKIAQALKVSLSELLSF